jgi:hypothetical protein
VAVPEQWRRSGAVCGLRRWRRCGGGASGAAVERRRRGCYGEAWRCTDAVKQRLDGARVRTEEQGGARARVWRRSTAARERKKKRKRSDERLKKGSDPLFMG